MTEYPNLRGSFTHVVEGASLRDLATIIDVMSDHLVASCPHVSELLDQALEALQATIRTHHVGRLPQ